MTELPLAITMVTNISLVLLWMLYVWFQAIAVIIIRFAELAHLS